MMSDPQPLKIARVKLEFALALNDRNDNRHLISATLRRNGEDLLLEPVRAREKRAGVAAAREYTLLPSPRQKPLLLDLKFEGTLLDAKTFSLPHDTSVGLSLDDGDAALLLQGALNLALPATLPQGWRSYLVKLWPTAFGPDVSHILLSPAGLHLGGLLPLALRPTNAGAAFRGLLRPRHRRDAPAPLDAILRDWPGLRHAKRWTLASAPASPSQAPDWLTATDFVNEWSERLQSQGRAPSLIQSVERTSQDYAVSVFGLPNQVLCLGRDLGLRIALAGGQQAEASFFPTYLKVEATFDVTRNPDDWIKRPVEFVTPPRTTPGEQTTGKVTLSVHSNSEPALQLEEVVVEALTLPVTRLPGGEAETYAAWLCTERGWLSVEAPDARARTEGALIESQALSGTLNLDALMQSLQPAPNGAEGSGLRVTLGALDSGRITLQLTEAATATSPAELKLEILNPFLMVQTPPVWLAQAASPGRLPPPLPSDAAQPEAALAAMFAAATFVSRRTGIGVAPVRATLQYDGAFALALHHQTTGRQRVTVWQPQGHEPWVQSFPLSPSGGEMLDANRGLFGWNPRAASVPVKFFPLGLPAPDEQGQADWQVAQAVSRRTRYFLPTLPGLEFDPFAESERQVYRHAVPVLDEAYTLLRETASGPDGSGGLGAGLDASRVEQTVGFSLSPATNTATGLLHKTASNPAGTIAFRLAGTPRLSGLQPEIKLALGEAQIQRVLKRTGTDVDGAGLRTAPGAITLKLKAELEPVAGADQPLRKVQVVAAPDDSDSSLCILNNGQPLLAFCLPEASGDEAYLMTSDGEGLAQEEPGQAAVAYKLRNGQTGYRMTERLQLGENLALELCGIVANYSWAETPPELRDGQAWMLHDGVGGWPKLFGFLFYPLALEEAALAQSGNERRASQITLTGRLLLRLPPGGLAVAGGELKVVFSKVDAGEESKWQLAEVTGDLDWRLSLSADTSGCALTRICAAVQSAEDHTLSLAVTRLEINSPLGPIAFGDGSATLENGVLNIARVKQTFSASDQDALELSLAEASLTPQSSTDGFRYQEFVCKWRRQLDEGGTVQLELVYQKDPNQEPAWHTVLSRRERKFGAPNNMHYVELVNSPLAGLHRVAASECLFFLEANDATSVADEMGEPAAAWFKRALADTGVIGLTVVPQRTIGAAEPTIYPVIGNIAADILLQLTDKRTSQSKLVIHLRVGSAAKDGRFEFEASGVLAVQNWLKLTSGSQTVPHQARIYLDRLALAPAVMVAWLEGRAFDEPVSFGAVVEHELGFADRPVRWQCPQAVTLQAVSAFATSALGEKNLRVTIPFNQNSINLNNADKTKLRTIITTLEQLSQMHGKLFVSVEGHAVETEAEGKAAQRARVIADFLESDPRVQAAGAEVFEHAWGTARPLKAGADGDNRRATVLIGGELLIDASSVSLLSVKANPPRLPAALSDVAGGAFLGISLRAKASSEQLNPADELAVARMPFAAVSPAVESRYTHHLTLDSAGVPKPTYGSAGAQATGVLTAPPTAPAEAVARLQRSATASWLAADFLLAALLAEPAGKLAPEPEFRLRRPQYRGKNGPAYLLPTTLPDLAWVRAALAQDAGPGKVMQACAAALVTRERLREEGAEDSSSMQPTFLNYPFSAEPFNVEPSATISDQVQLFVRMHDRFVNVLNAVLPPVTRTENSDEETAEEKAARIQQWALAELQRRGRFTAAVVLLNHAQFYFIPAPFQARHEEIPDVALWPLADAGGAEVMERDPRCLRPDAYGAAAAVTLQAAPDLGLLVFAGEPARVPAGSTLPGVSATGFRLAPTGERAMANGQLEARGRLRQARVARQSTEGWLALSKHDRVEFAAVAHGYPAPLQRPLTERRLSPPGLADEAEPPAATLLPPLVDVLAWSGRPGDVTRTHFAANLLDDIAPVANGPRKYTLSAQGGTAVSLRRPRALAGSAESVSLLEKEPPRRLFGSRFAQVTFLLEQQLGVTERPAAGTIAAVLTTVSAFAASAPTQPLAQTNPAFVKFKRDANDRLSLEPLQLFVTAGAGYVFPADMADRQWATVFLLALDEIPEELASVEPECNETTTDGKVKVIRRATAGALPEIIFGTERVPLSEFAAIGKGCADIRTDLTRFLQSAPSSTRTVQLAVCVFARPADGSAPWQRQGNPQFVLTLALLDQKQAIQPPPPALTVLAYPADQPEQVRVAGFGKLNDELFAPLAPRTATATELFWSRVAEIQLLNRLPGAEAPDKQTAWKYDPVLYGPGGELIPTEATPPNP